MVHHHVGGVQACQRLQAPTHQHTFILPLHLKVHARQRMVQPALAGRCPSASLRWRADVDTGYPRDTLLDTGAAVARQSTEQVQTAAVVKYRVYDQIPLLKDSLNGIKPAMVSPKCSTAASSMAGPGRLAATLLLGALLGACPSLAQVTPGAIVLKNKHGVEAHILLVGACIQRLLVPGQDGLKDVMMGFEDVEQYRVRAVPGQQDPSTAAPLRRPTDAARGCLALALVSQPRSHTPPAPPGSLVQNGTSVTGCMVGRVGGRISNAQFSLDGARSGGGVSGSVEARSPLPHLCCQQLPSSCGKPGCCFPLSSLQQFGLPDCTGRFASLLARPACLPALPARLLAQTARLAFPTAPCCRHHLQAGCQQWRQPHPARRRDWLQPLELDGGGQALEVQGGAEPPQP